LEGREESPMPRIQDEKKLYCSCGEKFDVGPLPASTLKIMTELWYVVHSGKGHKGVTEEEHKALAQPFADYLIEELRKCRTLKA
jgi:hypothetical protein